MNLKMPKIVCGACRRVEELSPRGMRKLAREEKATNDPLVARGEDGALWRVTGFDLPRAWVGEPKAALCATCAASGAAFSPSPPPPADFDPGPPRAAIPAAAEKKRQIDYQALRRVRLDTSLIVDTEPPAPLVPAQPVKKKPNPFGPSQPRPAVPSSKPRGRTDRIPQTNDQVSISSNMLSAKRSNVSGIVNGAVPPTTATPFLPTKRPSRVDQIQPSAPSARAAVTGNAPIVRQDPAGNATPFEAPRVANSAATTQFVNRPVPTKSVPIERERYARQSITGAANAQPLKKA